jgi:hypothetical protein
MQTVYCKKSTSRHIAPILGENPVLKTFLPWNPSKYQQYAWKISILQNRITRKAGLNERLD